MNIKIVTACLFSALVAACAGNVAEDPSAMAQEGPQDGLGTANAPTPSTTPATPIKCAQPVTYVKRSNPTEMIVGNTMRFSMVGYATCDEGDTVISGGCQLTATNSHTPRLLATEPLDASTWRCEASSDVQDVIGSPGNTKLVAVAVCMRH